MGEALFSFEPFEFNGIQGGYGSIEGFEKEISEKGKQDHLLGIEDWEEFESLCSQYGLFQESHPEKISQISKPQHHVQPPRSSGWTLDELQFDTVSPPISQPIQESKMIEDLQAGNKESNRENPYPFSLSSLELLNNYGGGVKKLKAENLKSDVTSEANVERQRLSTEEIMRVAGARFVEFSSQRGDDFALHMHPFGFALMGLSQEETKDVELVHLLLSAAEKVGYQQFERASRLLTQCEWMASDTGNPVERIVFYFAKALREKIDRETGRLLKGNGRKDLMDLGLGTNLASIACHQELPFTQLTQFTGVQAILEAVALSGQIHLIDLAIRSGVQWTALMHALSERENSPVSLLKITAVTTIAKNEVKETGKRLESFAESLNLPFSFKVVFVPEMKELREELLLVEAGEVVAVHAPLVLRSMISRPDHLDVLMRVIKNVSPSIMVVTEVEANHNSPSFVTRFIEALFFHSAIFDCLDVCMSKETQIQNRLMTEAIFFGEGIRNMIAAEGEERVIRNVKMDAWRAFFSRFGTVEIEFSEASLYQASLIVKQFSCGSFCSVENDGKCLIVEWKGTPILSLSAWKFT